MRDDVIVIVIEMSTRKLMSHARLAEAVVGILMMITTTGETMQAQEVILMAIRVIRVTPVMVVVVSHAKRTGGLRRARTPIVTQTA